MIRMLQFEWHDHCYFSAPLNAEQWGHVALQVAQWQGPRGFLKMVMHTKNHRALSHVKECINLDPSNQALRTLQLHVADGEFRWNLPDKVWCQVYVCLDQALGRTLIEHFATEYERAGVQLQLMARKEVLRENVIQVLKEQDHRYKLHGV